VVISPDGALVAYVRAATGSAPDTNVVVIADAFTGVEQRTFSRPGYQYCRLVFTADGSKLVCQRQREETYASEWRVTGSLCVTPDGSTLYALRSAIDSPPQVVRLDAAAADQQPAILKTPGNLGSLPGTLTEVHAEADVHGARLCGAAAGPGTVHRIRAAHAGTRPGSVRRPALP
jgi:dipeptidyl aminopeptidase/acylaminoacyl peptidase